MDTTRSDPPPAVSQQPSPQPASSDTASSETPSSDTASSDTASSETPSSPQEFVSEKVVPLVQANLRRWPWLLVGLAAGAIGVTVARQVPAVSRFFRTPGWRWTITTAIAEGILRAALAMQRIRIGRVPDLTQPIRKPSLPWRPSRAA